MVNQVVPQLIFHDHHYQERTSIFHNFKDLYTCSFNKLYEFQKLVFKGWKKK